MPGRDHPRVVKVNRVMALGSRWVLPTFLIVRFAAVYGRYSVKAEIDPQPRRKRRKSGPQRHRRRPFWHLDAGSEVHPIRLDDVDPRVWLANRGPISVFVARRCIVLRFRARDAKGTGMSYRYHDAKPTYANAYLWPALEREIQRNSWARKRAFDLGCGNGATCDMLSKHGFDVTGVDTSSSGIERAKNAFPHVRFEIGSAYDDLASRYGMFDLVVSLEVIEHCMEPRVFARAFLDLIAPGGIGFLSTPYHGYLKNVALAVSGKMDRHFSVLWDGGHIKFFSIKTLAALLREAGAQQVRYERVGRVPQLAKSMIAVVSTNGTEGSES